MAKKNPGKKPSVQREIDERRKEFRGGRSVREVSRHQHDLDERDGIVQTIRNRMTYCTKPDDRPNRMIKKAPASVEAPA